MTRLLDLGVPAYLLNATVLGVMAQRLVRTLCPHCKDKVPYGEDRADDVTWEELVSAVEGAAAGPHLQAGRLPRVPDDRLPGQERDLRGHAAHAGGQAPDQHDADLGKMREQAYKDGMKSLRISGAMKVAAGMTTFEEVLKVAPPHQHEGA